MKLHTGREVHYSNFGLDIDGRLTAGYDDDVYAANRTESDDEPGWAWTVAEKLEVADMMIARWQAYRAALTTPPPDP
jgi:hypothetical protein